MSNTNNARYSVAEVSRALCLSEGTVQRCLDAFGPPGFSVERVADAMQNAWNDFTTDTGCYPDCFKVEIGPAGKKRLTADFEISNFAEMVTGSLNAAPVSLKAGDASK